jgi:hypothetical protein
MRNWARPLGLIAVALPLMARRASAFIKYMLEVEHIDPISDEMRSVVESEWPELAHKLPPKN